MVISSVRGLKRMGSACEMVRQILLTHLGRLYLLSDILVASVGRFRVSCDVRADFSTSKSSQAELSA
jgi:hypothetical protein